MATQQPWTENLLYLDKITLQGILSRVYTLRLFIGNEPLELQKQDSQTWTPAQRPGVSPTSEMRVEIQMRSDYLVPAQILRATEVIDVQELFNDYWSSNRHEITVSKDIIVVGEHHRHRWCLDLQFSASSTMEKLRMSLYQIQGLLKEYSPQMGGSTEKTVEKAVEKALRYGALLSKGREWDGNSPDQARVFEILKNFAIQGSEGSQNLAQEVIASFTLYSDIPERARLLDLVDTLVVNCDDTFHRQLAEEGFFQTLISDEKVQTDPQFRADVQSHLATWLGSLSGKVSEIASDVLQLLSDSSKGESSTNRQHESSDLSGPSDQLLNRGAKEVITFQTPKLEKQLRKFLLSSYIQAGDILRKSRRLKWFSFQSIHIARQAFHLIIQFNDFIGPDGPTNEQYDEGIDLDDALEELEDKINELKKLDLDEAHRCEEDHKYDLARLYQIFFATRDFYPSGRDHKTDAVLKRLVDLDHATLILACCLQAQGPHIEDLQNVDVDIEEDGDNRGPILDVAVSQAEADDTEAVAAPQTDSGPLPTEEPQESPATPTFKRGVENVALMEPRSLAVEELVARTINDIESLKQGIIKTSKNDVQAPYTILLVGETGVGKSSFLGFLANVLIGNNAYCYDFEVLDRTNEWFVSSGQSTTNSAHLYELTSKNGIVARILDTPGLADTRGIQQDESHKRSIAAEIQKHIDSVTAILIIVNGTVPRITVGTDYALSTLSAIFPKSLVENTAFVFTNVLSPLSWDFSMDTIPYVLRNVPHFHLDNPVALQKKYLTLKGDQTKKDVKTELRRHVKAGEQKALEMMVKLFDWLDSLEPQPTVEIVRLYEISQDIEAMITNTLAQIEQAAEKTAEINRLMVDLKKNSDDVTALAAFERTVNKVIWMQWRTATNNLLCGEANCYSNCYIDYKTNIPLNLRGLFGRPCHQCKHSLWNHHQSRSMWKQLTDSHVSVDQNMKEKWEAARNGKEKTYALVGASEKVLRDLNQVIDRAINDLEQLVGRYASLSLSGNFSVQVGSAVRLLEQNYAVLENKSVSTDQLHKVKRSADHMKRKLELLNKAREA